MGDHVAISRLTSSALALALTAGVLGVALAGGGNPPATAHDDDARPASSSDDAFAAVHIGPRPAAHRHAPRLRVRVTLNSAGARYVGTRVPIKGYLSGNTAGVRKRLVLHRKVGSGPWRRVATKFQRKLGVYRMPAQRITRPGPTRFRTSVWVRGKRLRVSKPIRVRGVARPKPDPVPTRPPRPDSITQQRTIEGAVACERLTVALLHQERTSIWTWNAGTRRWVLSWSPWTTASTSERRAVTDDCVNLVEETSADILLPDIRIRNLDKCGAGDLALGGGQCFRIVNPAPTVPDFPHLSGRKLLKFPVITLNVGAGPTEVLADRSSPTEESWRAYQSFLRPDGSRESVTVDGAEFYFAGDGHDHWHIRDFDDYVLIDAESEVVATAEKHGYCLEDNTRYTPMAGQPGVPPAIVYANADMCGKGLPEALTIIHGMSRGWGDTYPSTLPDQALDITGIADGTYTVRVVADARGLLRESNEANNAAEVQIEIAGDTVTVLPGTASGGLP